MIGKTIAAAVAVALLAASSSVVLGQGTPATPASTPAVAASAADTSPLPIIFTTQQVSLGRSTYNLVCAVCHGQAPPQLPAFMRTNLADPFGFISSNMPADAPGSLPKETYAAILAYFLQNMGYVSGPEPLPIDMAILARMLVTPVTP